MTKRSRLIITRKYLEAESLQSFAVSIANCAELAANTLVNPAWLPGYPELAYYYPNVPTTGTEWNGIYRDLMSFRSQDDIDDARAALRTRMWQSTGMISGTYDRLTTDVANTDGTTDPSVHDAYEVDMPYWLTTSRIWLYHTPETPSGWLVIVHGGHDNHGPEHATVIPIRQALLAAGHDVLVVSMPGQSINIPAGPYPYLGTFNGPMSSHNNVQFYDRAFLAQTALGGSFGVPPESCLHVFYAPTHRMINALVDDYDHVAITGLSGGCSSAIVNAALDTRIERAYVIAGSGAAPRFAIYEDTHNFGDSETQIITWMGIANEEETWNMICDGGRRAVVTIGDNDVVFAPGVDIQQYAAAAIYEAANIGNGQLSFTVQHTSAHEWNTTTITAILADLEDDSELDLDTHVLTATIQAIGGEIASIIDGDDGDDDDSNNNISVYSGIGTNTVSTSKNISAVVGDITVRAQLIPE